MKILYSNYNILPSVSSLSQIIPINIMWSYILIINLIHWLLFIHKILYFSTCFEPQVLIFSRIQLYTCSIWYCHSLWEFLVACRYTDWVRTDRMWSIYGALKTLTPMVKKKCIYSWLSRERKTIFHVKATVFLKNNGVSVVLAGGRTSLSHMGCFVTNST